MSNDVSITLVDRLEPEQVDTEDGGQAKIAHGFIMNTSVNPDIHFFVRLQSWDETKQHVLFNSLVGKKLRITVEVIP